MLNEAAVGRGHRTAHDARRAGLGRAPAAVYRLLEGEPATLGATRRVAVWVEHAAAARRAPLLGELLGDGMDPAHAGLWRRQLVLGPAPEFCLLAAEPPAGVARAACRRAGARGARARAALGG